MIYEDLVKRLREGCFAPITRLPIQSDEARLRRAAADALEHMAASEYALAKEIDALVKELDEAQSKLKAQKGLLGECRRIVRMYRGITEADGVVRHASSIIKRIDEVIND